MGGDLVEFFSNTDESEIAENNRLYAAIMGIDFIFNKRKIYFIIVDSFNSCILLSNYIVF